MPCALMLFLLKLIPYSFSNTVYLCPRRLEWKNFEVTVIERKSIVVRDVMNDSKETLGMVLCISKIL